MATVTKKLKRAVPILQFEDLPAEIDIKVMSYLDITDLIKFTRVSKKIRALGPCLELEGQGHGIIMGVMSLLLPGQFYTIQTKTDKTF